MFSSVSEITNLKSKKFFIEKIQLYIKIVDQTLLANNLIPPKEKTEVTSLINKRLIELNIISKSDDITQLSKVLKAQLFNDFITALKASSDHKKIISNSLDKLDPKKRRKLQLSEAKKNKPKIVDFFCGAGGLSLGFIREGFSIDLANDYEDVCIETYRYNHPEISSERVILGDIRDLVNDINSYIKDDIDVVVGGPPCQGFSSANQQRIIDDPRNELYKYFIRAVTAIAPKFVIMENVRGMLPYADQISTDLKDMYFNLDMTYFAMVKGGGGEISGETQREEGKEVEGKEVEVEGKEGTGAEREEASASGTRCCSSQLKLLPPPPPEKLTPPPLPPNPVGPLLRANLGEELD